MDIRRVILDFDGTCTQISRIAEEYLERYRLNFIEEVGPLSTAEWTEALANVREHSPHAGWTVAGPPAAPCAADPYILADEASRHLLRQRRRDNSAPPSSLNARAYAAVPAPWREDARQTFLQLIRLGVTIHFVSNSSSTMIRERLEELFDDADPALRCISVQSDAGKFRISELPWEAEAVLSQQNRARFLALPAVCPSGINGPRRPIYLRRGAYFQAICRVLGGDLSELPQTIFCGDIWEMDLAMPAALGASVHLLDRAPPFDTYTFEREAVALLRSHGRSGQDLASLLGWFTDGPSSFDSGPK